MKKIVFYAHSMFGGGAEKACYLYANRFAEDANFLVYLFLNDRDGDFLPLLNPRIKIIGIKNFNFKPFNLFARLSGGFNLFIFFSLLLNLIRIKPGYLISFAEWPNLYAGLSKFILRNRYTCVLYEQNTKTFVNDYEVYRVPLLIKKLALRSYEKADKIFSCSEIVARGIKRIYPNKDICVVYNPVDCVKVNVLGNLPTKEYFDNNYINLVAVGRLSPQKDYKTMLNAFERAYETKKNIALFILGNGEERDCLFKTVQEFNSKQEIKFLGFLDNPYAYMKSADVLIHSAIYEGFGNVFIEALAVGTPILTTDCESPKEIIKNSLIGKIVPVSGEEQLASEIINLKKKNNEVIEDCMKRAKDFDIENCFNLIKSNLNIA